jgi:hypothetical protein
MFFVLARGYSPSHLFILSYNFVSEESSMENSKDEEDCSNATFCLVDLISLIAARHCSCSFCDVSVNIWHLQFLRFRLDAVMVGAYGKGWMDVFWRHIGRVMC